VNDADGPIVGLLLESRPQTLTIVRGVLSGIAETLEMDPELLDDLKTSVSEACNNVVLHAYGEGTGPMGIRVYADGDEIRVTVDDEGVGLQGAEMPTDGSHGIGVSVIEALAREAHFTPRPGGGTEVTMTFDGRRDDQPLFTTPGSAAAELPLGPVAEGEVGLTLSPVSLLAVVLGRLARTLAATAHFSLDRFSDVYLVTDTLAAHAAGAAAADRVLARLSASERRLRVVLGPFRPGSGAALADTDADRVSSPLSLLADEIAVREWEHGEAIDVVVVDHRR
jgi:anti-sigma regulatory factor (Ser/Thr protein kinase)